MDIGNGYTTMWTSCHWIVHLKMAKIINFMFYRSYQNKKIKEKLKTPKKESKLNIFKTSSLKSQKLLIKMGRNFKKETEKQTCHWLEKSTE